MTKKELYKLYQEAQKMPIFSYREEARGVYISENTLYINKENYSFKLNIENIIKLKNSDFKKIISEINDHDEIITQLLEIYEKKKDIYKYPAVTVLKPY